MADMLTVRYCGDYVGTIKQKGNTLVFDLNDKHVEELLNYFPEHVKKDGPGAMLDYLEIAFMRSQTVSLARGDDGQTE